MSVDSFKKNIRTAFDSLDKRVNGQGSGPLHTRRRTAIEAFEDQGVPTPRNEEWKYTNLLPLMTTDYLPAGSAEQSTDEHSKLKSDIDARLAPLRASLPEGSSEIVFVNGQFSAELTSLAEDVPCEVLTDELVAGDEEVQELLTNIAGIDAHPFVALNTALTANGVLIRVPKNTKINAPIHVASIGVATENDILHTPRVLVIAEEGAEVDVVESHETLGSKAAFDVSVAELVAHRNARISYSKMNDDKGDGKHIGFIGGKVHRDAVITTNTFCLGGPFTRNDIELALVEENSEAYMNGVSALSEKQYADNHTVVDHMVPNCHSDELYKGVYDDQSTGVFNGKIYVRPQAQKTTAYQSNHSLLLSERAQMNAKPQLEIWADDVKCSHGATTGQLDEEAVFYLRSRGVGMEEARALMTYAFAAEAVERLHLDGLRSYVEHRIADKLGAEPFSDELVIDE